MPINWSDFTNADSASAKIGVLWMIELTTTDGFDVVKYSADDELPSWIALDVVAGYTGAAAVKLMAVYGTAKSDEYSKHHANHVGWEAGDFEPKMVTVETVATAPGDPDRKFALHLYSAGPIDLV